ncbi:hypothetical protein TNCV_2487531 [Trichonephila clavipes]|uniref:Uncharacterized protein n=1 Tax=Trichonephila clavipes TaxID=2585209 RepID=A0A8X6W006_TRICX|nr:hypothetical protein TNCV_2487531 [Trichonephila clavipes]
MVNNHQAIGERRFFSCLRLRSSNFEVNKLRVAEVQIEPFARALVPLNGRYVWNQTHVKTVEARSPYTGVTYTPTNPSSWGGGASNAWLTLSTYPLLDPA